MCRDADVSYFALLLCFNKAIVDVIFLVVAFCGAVELVYVQVIGLKIGEGGVKVFFELLFGSGLGLR